MASGSDRERALREAAREQRDHAQSTTPPPITEDQRARSWTHEGGMVEQQASAMEWVRASHEQRLNSQQHDNQAPEIPEQGSEAPPLPANDSREQTHSYSALRAENFVPAEQEREAANGPDDQEQERVRRVLADLNRNSGREQESQELPSNDNIKGQARNYNDLKVEQAREMPSEDDQEKQRVQRVMADLNRNSQQREQELER